MEHGSDSAAAASPRMQERRGGGSRARGLCSSSIPVAWRWAGRMLATTPKAAVTTNGETRARTGDTAIRSCAAIRDHVCGRPYRRRQPADVRSGSYRFSRRPHAPLRHRRAHHSRARLPVARRARRSSHPRRLRAGRVNARHSPAPGRRVVGLVFAVRNRSAELDVLPQLVVDGLGPADARALLGSAIGGPIDEPRTSTARRSTGSAAPACAWRSRALVSSTANGCAASAGVRTRATSSAAPTRHSRRWAPRPSPRARSARCVPPVPTRASARSRSVTAADHAPRARPRGVTFMFG